jgi:hypothetical protein
MIDGKGHGIEMDTDAVLAALRKTRALRMSLDVLWGDYLIVTPINPMNPPGQEDMEKAVAALHVLDDLGLLPKR